jgi:hypothetical protein
MNTDRVRGDLKACGAALWPRGRSHVGREPQNEHKMDTKWSAAAARRDGLRRPRRRLRDALSPTRIRRPILCSSCVHFVVHDPGHKGSTGQCECLGGYGAGRQPLCSSVSICGSPGMKPGHCEPTQRSASTRVEPRMNTKRTQNGQRLASAQTALDARAEGFPSPHGRPGSGGPFCVHLVSILWFTSGAMRNPPPGVAARRARRQPLGSSVFIRGSTGLNPEHLT